MDNISYDISEKRTSSWPSVLESSFYSEVKLGTVYTCCYCENVFSNKYFLVRHKRKHNFCKYCKSKFKTQIALTKHKKNCVFEKCMTSCPVVELSNIALSKKIRTLYNSAFSQRKFPSINFLRFGDIKESIEGCASQNSRINENPLNNLKNDVNFSSSNTINHIVKFEPIDYEESIECSIEKRNESLFRDNVENFDELNKIDNAEKHLINYCLPTSVEEFFSDYSERNSFLSNQMGFSTDVEINNEINTRYMNVDSNIFANESTIGKYQLYCRKPRICYYKSEFQKQILCEPVNGYKFADGSQHYDHYNEMINEFQNYSYSKNNFEADKLMSSVKTETEWNERNNECSFIDNTEHFVKLEQIDTVEDCLVNDCFCSFVKDEDFSDCSARNCLSNQIEFHTDIDIKIEPEYCD